MNIRTALAFAGLVLVASWVWWRFLRIARPAFPPLHIQDDDPLMATAIENARNTIDRFRRLYALPHRGAKCKVPFVTSSGVREYLWAEVTRFEGQDVEVRYLTPPVTHRGRLERMHRLPLTEVVDWQLELPDGRYRGGFTMRAMFVRAREQWGSLPPALDDEQRKYADEP